MRLTEVTLEQASVRLQRTATAPTATWLGQHPTVTVVCRDRRDLDADGIRRGAQEAVQVVGRFPLVQNLRRALDACLLDHRPVLQAAAVGTALALMPPTGPVSGTPMSRGRRRSPKPPPQRAARPPRHARWVAIYAAVHTLRAQGMPLATSARHLGNSRPTVYAYLRRDTPPTPRGLQRSGQVPRPYIPYLIRRGLEHRAHTDSVHLRCRSPCSARRPSGRAMHRRMWTSSVQSMRASRARIS